MLKVLVAGGGPAGDQAAERLGLLRETGQLSPREERLMSTFTRSAKTPVTHRDLDAHWRQTARRHGLELTAVDRLRGPLPMKPAGRDKLLDGLTEFDATFPARDARAVALERSAGVPIAEALEPLRELRASEDILVLADGTGTTREHRGRERTTVAIAERLADATVLPLPAGLVAAESERLNEELGKRGGSLSVEQRRAIELACGTRRLVVIEGQAGTGKSTTLTGITRAHQAAGRQIVVTSTRCARRRTPRPRTRRGRRRDDRVLHGGARSRDQRGAGPARRRNDDRARRGRARLNPRATATPSGGRGVRSEVDRGR